MRRWSEIISTCNWHNYKDMTATSKSHKTTELRKNMYIMPAFGLNPLALCRYCLYSKNNNNKYNSTILRSCYAEINSKEQNWIFLPEEKQFLILNVIKCTSLEEGGGTCWYFTSPLSCNHNLIQNSPAVKKCVAPKKAIVQKRCEIQSGGQEMAVMVGYGKNFNNDNSGEFVLPSPQDLEPNSPELMLLKFFPLTYHHSFLAAT